MTTVSLIVAAADNNVIGKNNELIWHIPEDLKRFKALTLGKPCLMGRKTFESILAQLGKPLPGRTNIVISRTPRTYEGAIACASLQLAIKAAREDGAQDIMIIGGAQIYKEALEADLVDRIYLTRVHQSPEGDAFFPPLPADQWRETARIAGDSHSFIDLEKIR